MEIVGTRHGTIAICVMPPTETVASGVVICWKIWKLGTSGLMVCEMCLSGVRGHNPWLGVRSCSVSTAVNSSQVAFKLYPSSGSFTLRLRRRCPQFCPRPEY